MGYENKSSILTPLYRHGKIIGVFAMSSTSLAEYFIPSVRNLAKHISTALELAEEHAERKRAEERYRDLIEKEKDIIYTLDCKGNTTFSSPAVKTILGYRPEELIGKNFMVLIPKEWQERTGDDFNNLLKIGEITAETVLLDKKGQSHFVEYSSTVIKEGGKVVGTRGIARDITERRRVEEEIIRTKEDLQNIIDSASEVIISFDANNRVTTWNNTAEFITGYKQREVIGKKITRLNVFDSPSKVIYLIKSVSDGNKDGFDEFILKTKDGAKQIIRASYSAITSDKDHNIGVLLIGKNITRDVGSHGRLLKGNSYLISNNNNKPAVDLFVNLAKSDFEGLFITRINPDMLKSMPSLKGVQVVLLNQDKMGGFENIRDLDGLTAKIEEFTKENIDSVILLDRIDYLTTLFSFERFVESLYQINSIISKNNSILLLYLNPSFLDTRQMAIIEAELQPLPDQKIEDVQIEDELYNILEFIQRQNQNNSLVSFKTISKEFSIVKSTSAKRLRMLEDKGLILVKKRGRSKTLYVSEKGKTLLNKRQTI